MRTLFYILKDVCLRLIVWILEIVEPVDDRTVNTITIHLFEGMPVVKALLQRGVFVF